MNKPLVTVSIATYNRLSLLKECLQSISHQLSKEVDVLIVDDGSEFKTRDWLKSIKNTQIKIIFQNNQGVAKARQVGLENINTEYVLILDSDDKLLDNAVSRILKEIKSKPEVDLFYTNNLEVFPSGKRISSKYRRYEKNTSFIHSILTKPRIPFKHSGTTFKTKKALDIGGYDTSLKSKIDLDFIIRFLKMKNNCHFIDEPLIEFNFHFDSISRKSRLKGLKSWWIVINKNTSSNLLIKVSFFLQRALWEIIKASVELFLGILKRTK